MGKDESEEGIFKAIRKDPLNFYKDDWEFISEDVKNLIQQMLVKDPAKRISA